MIALSIALTWLTLTVAGFHILTVLGRVEARTDFEADEASRAGGMFSTPDTLSDPRAVTVPRERAR
jgi:hypothetical protein